jgi:hypothetical protein
MVLQAEGYVSDVPYVRVFIPHLVLACPDHVAIVCGVAPPMRKERFAWCGLGCGQGVTAAMLAAMHPVGQFHGIDAMSGRIDHARQLADEADVPNVNFHASLPTVPIRGLAQSPFLPLADSAYGPFLDKEPGHERPHQQDAESEGYENFVCRQVDVPILARFERIGRAGIQSDGLR